MITGNRRRVGIPGSVDRPADRTYAISADVTGALITCQGPRGAAIDALCRTPRIRDTGSARQFQEGRIELSGGTIAYTIAGDGPTLLLTHGLGGSRQTWRHLIGGLSRTHTVFASEVPGHGESDPPAGDYSLGAHACALRDLLLALEYRRCSLTGHSLGGGIALQMAYQFPERIERLILIGSGGLGSEVSFFLRAATLPGAGAVIAAMSAIPAAVTNHVLAVIPKTRREAYRRPVARTAQHEAADRVPAHGAIGDRLARTSRQRPAPDKPVARCSGTGGVGCRGQHHPPASLPRVRTASARRGGHRDPRSRPLSA